MKDINAAKFL